MSLKGTGEISLEGLQVLVVEDEYMVASLLEEYLVALGCGVIGPASTAAKANALLKRYDIDAAILDINLNPGTSEPVARRLIDLDIPFVFVTGYSDLQMLASDLRDMTIVHKPVHQDRFSQVLTDLARRARTSG